MVTPQHFVHRLVIVPRITQWVVPKPSLACRGIHSWAKSIWLLKQPQPTLNFYLFYIGCSLVRPKWWANSTWHIVEGKTDLMSLIGLLQHPTLFRLDIILALTLIAALFSPTSTPCDLQHSVNCTKFSALTPSLPQRSSDAGVAALKEGAKTVVRGKKEPRRRRKRGRGRVQEKPWK